MFIGHYGACFVLKRIEPRVPLWVLFIAVQLVDLAWCLFVFAGVEHAEVTARYRGSLPLELIYMPYTHSLAAVTVWATAVFVIARATMRDMASPNRIALVLALAVVSHWLLDFIVHRPDLPLYGDAHKVGLALWNQPLLAFALEAACYFGALHFYRRAMPAPSGRVIGGLFWLGVVLLAVQVVLFYIPLLPSIAIAATLFLVTFLQLAWLARWIEAGAAETRPSRVSERI